jgi:hypothetical protein
MPPRTRSPSGPLRLHPQWARRERGGGGGGEGGGDTMAPPPPPPAPRPATRWPHNVVHAFSAAARHRQRPADRGCNPREQVSWGFEPEDAQGQSRTLAQHRRTGCRGVGRCVPARKDFQRVAVHQAHRGHSETRADRQNRRSTVARHAVTYHYAIEGTERLQGERQAPACAAAHPQGAGLMQQLIAAQPARHKSTAPAGAVLPPCGNVLHLLERDELARLL